jgi:hypothetical protein
MEGTRMRNVITTIVLLLILLSTACSVHAYVYYVEAEAFDPDTSVLSAGGGTWTITEDENVSNGKYMKYSGPHVGANTSLFYTLPSINDNPGQCRVWFHCFSPDTATDSYFVYVSTDGGEDWGPQQTVVPAVNPDDWQWMDFVPTTPFERGEGNVLRIAEREYANLDLICIRNDGGVPSVEDYVIWLEEWEAKQRAVEPGHKMATTWGSIRSEY